MGADNTAHELLGEVQALLRFQGELGLESLRTPEDFLEVPEPIQTPARVVPSSFMPSEKPAVPKAQPTASSTDSLCGMRLTGGALDSIIHEIGPCQRCELHKRRSNIVFGVGNPNARLMFVGEGPGRDEDLQAEPFVGKAGKLLDKMIGAMGLQRRDVYIANIVKCRPPRNRDPEPHEVEQCEPFLRQQIEVIKPEVLVALGRYAAQALTRDSTPISKMRGQWMEYEGIPLMPTFHPAYLLRNAAGKRPVWNDLQDVMKRLGMSLPQK